MHQQAMQLYVLASAEVNPRYFTAKHMLTTTLKAFQPSLQVQTITGLPAFKGITTSEVVVQKGVYNPEPIKKITCGAIFKEQ